MDRTKCTEHENGTIGAEAEGQRLSGGGPREREEQKTTIAEKNSSADIAEATSQTAGRGNGTKDSRMTNTDRNGDFDKKRHPKETTERRGTRTEDTEETYEDWAAAVKRYTDHVETPSKKRKGSVSTATRPRDAVRPPKVARRDFFHRRSFPPFYEKENQTPRNPTKLSRAQLDDAFRPVYVKH